VHCQAAGVGEAADRDPSLDEKFEGYMTGLVDLASAIPDDVPLGRHWCYGTWGGWPITEMSSLELGVRLSNAVRASI
jgi:hypothetical protein